MSKFTPGTPKHPNSGRRKGVANRSTQAVREALVEAFGRKGGVDYLLGLDDDIFSRLLVRLIPNEIAAKVEQTTRLHVIDLSDQRKGDADGMAEG